MGEFEGCEGDVGGEGGQDRRKDVSLHRGDEVGSAQKADGSSSSVNLWVGTLGFAGKCDLPFATSMADLAALCMGEKVPFLWETISNESLVQRGRNALCAMFLRSRFEYMLMADSDIIFEASQILEMLRLMEKGDLEVLGGIYPKKVIRWDRVEQAVKAGNSTDMLAHCSGDCVWSAQTKDQEFDVHEIAASRWVGTGMLLVRRSVFERLKPITRICYPHRPELPKTIGLYFDCDLSEELVYLSEDFWFCEQLQKVGITPYVAPWVRLKHVGTYVYEGCPWCSIGQTVHKPAPARIVPEGVPEEG